LVWTALKQDSRAQNHESIYSLFRRPGSHRIPSCAQATKRRPAIELLFDQLRACRLAAEQKETYVKQQETALQLRELNEATAAAAKQAELTQTKIEIEVAANRGSAQLAEAEGLAKRDIARAEGESRASELLGGGEAARVSQVGEAEANVNRRKVEAYRDPRLFALNLLGEQLSRSAQPLVPERVLLFGQPQENGAASPRIEASGLLSALLGLLVSEKSGFNVLAPNDPPRKRATTMSGREGTARVI
jgi:uncharacterized membrane protein YqiK